MVYVQNNEGKPLMPCHEAMARKLLREGKAYIVRRDIFTIRLHYGSSGYKQEIILGIDAGTKYIGFSATTIKKELISGIARLRTDVVKLLSDRRMLRRDRRARKTRYRKAKFNNRISSKREGWIAPSIRQKVYSHVRLALLIDKILPISKIIVEVANFDLQKIKNQEIQGDIYQYGEQYAFENVREYVLYRDGYICRHCHGQSKDKILQVHHIESRKIGGNAPNNLITLCKTCHDAYHKGKIILNVQRDKSLRSAAVMNIMRWRIVDELRKYFNTVMYTYGYITKYDRINIGLLKSHYNDAFCITKNFSALKLNTQYVIKFIAKHSRILHLQKPSKGGKRRSMSAPYWLKNSRFTRYDKVLFNGLICFISGRSNGRAVLRDIDGNMINGCKSTITTKKLRLITHCRGSMLIA